MPFSSAFKIEQPFFSIREISTGALAACARVTIFIKKLTLENLPQQKDPNIDSQSRLKAIIETAVDGIITIDTRGIIETVNPAAARIFGYQPEEIIGHNVSMLMPEPDHSAHDSLY